MNLANAPVEGKLKIIKIDAGREARGRLTALGFHPGDIVLRLSNGNWGPILVKNMSINSSKIALGRGMAEKILVEVA